MAFVITIVDGKVTGFDLYNDTSPDPKNIQANQPILDVIHVHHKRVEVSLSKGTEMHIVALGLFYFSAYDISTPQNLFQ